MHLDRSQALGQLGEFQQEGNTEDKFEQYTIACPSYCNPDLDSEEPSLEHWPSLDSTKPSLMHWMAVRLWRLHPACCWRIVLCDLEAVASTSAASGSHA